MAEEVRSNRRRVLKALLAGVLLASSIVRDLFAQAPAKAAAVLKLIDERKDYSAKAIGYRHDGAKTTRKDPKEHCGTCKQYKKVGLIDREEVGSCSLLKNGLVKEEGWCRSYLKDEALYRQNH